MMILESKLSYALRFVLILIIPSTMATVDIARDNGDIYITNEEIFVLKHSDLFESDEETTTITAADIIIPRDANVIDFEALAALCNSSFSLPMDQFLAFNTTGELPDVVDKTGMCFVRCFYEKSGILENWKLNLKKIQTNWPMEEDVIVKCEKEGVTQVNPCVRAYAIAKCVTQQALGRI